MPSDACLGNMGLTSKDIVQTYGDAGSRLYIEVKKTPDHLYCYSEDVEQLKDYVVLTKFLKNNYDLNIPEIIEERLDDNFYIVEKVKGTLLSQSLGVANEEKTQKLVEKALDIIVEIQKYGSPKDIDGFKFSKRKFDCEKLNQELDKSLDYFAKRSLKINGQDFRDLQDFCRELSQELEKNIHTLCHRDYHSKNLILNNKEELHIIDFQDFHLGNTYYDLVSFLEDPYFSYDEGIKEMAKKYFASTCKLDFDVELYSLTAFQRLLKVLGSYTFFYYETGRENYLRYISTSFENLRRVSIGSPSLDKPYSLLSKYYYDN